MDDSQKDFDFTFRDRGGLFDHSFLEKSDIIPHFLELARLKIAERKKLNEYYGELYIDIINNSNLNAAAGKYNSNYFIGISAGAISLLFRFFMRILSDPALFKEFGHAEKEVTPETVYNIQTTDVLRYLDVIGNHPTPVS